MGVAVGTSVRVGVLLWEGSAVNVFSVVFAGGGAVKNGGVSACEPQAETENIRTKNTNKCFFIVFPFYSENKKRQFITAS